MVQLTLILDNLRSAHNVGAILRTADATGVNKVLCSGTTPYPKLLSDTRDPVASGRNTKLIRKTALGAETTVNVEYFDNTLDAIAEMRAKSCTIIALEQAPDAVNLLGLEPPQCVALVVGNEVDGVTPDVLSACDIVAELPQRGDKESLNVASATAVALYQLLF